ncbi:MAG: family 78 glycoside hydrolase catalytic domain [Thermoflavifilum aggregans]|nr:family 78 glycoside hydrolase catalytic domain [Thermoflavifilum aggregans]
MNKLEIKFFVDLCAFVSLWQRISVYAIPKGVFRTKAPIPKVAKSKLISCCLIILFATANAQSRIIISPSPVVKIYDLRCQYLKNPVGIDQKAPSFSWKLSNTGHNVKQIAYQIVVASSKEKLEHDPDLWNSGKVVSDQNTFITYKGKQLQSAHQYYWKVKIWTNKNREAEWSDPAFFVTGMLDDNEWNDAQWIAYEKLPDSMKVFPGVHGSGDNLGNKAVKKAVIPCFRKDFQINKKVEQAYVYVCGLGQYVLYINGKRPDTGFLNPTWSDYTKRCYYNSYDVTQLLKDGENTLGAIVGTGFLYINRERYRKLVIAAGYPMLRLKMIIRYADGTTKEIVTDTTWETAPSAITYSSIYGGEDFDANRVQKDWNLPTLKHRQRGSSGLEDEGWKTPVVVSGVGGRMEAQEAYPVVVNQKFNPVWVDSSKTDYRMYDFGQNISGIVHLKVRGPKGYKVRIIPAELIHKDHTPDQSASGQPYYWQYTFNGEGIEEWQPLFSYYGFRYVGIKVFDPEGYPVDINKINIEAITAFHTQNAAPKVGSFSCSDTLFNQIFQLIHWGIRNNLSNVATDCPHREKLGWLEETHLLGNSIQYNYDILRFYNKIAKDMQDAQLQNGLVPDIAPEYVEFADGFRDSPEWGSASILVPWYVYHWYGDKQILIDNYAMMKRYVDYLKNKADHYLLAYGLGDWYDLGPKHPGVSQLTPLGVTATAFYYYDSKIVSEVAALLHHPEDAAKYAKIANAVRAAFNQKYYNPNTKVYASGSQTSYAIPLYFGIAPEKDRTAILKNLVDSVKANHYALTAGDIGFRYLVQALEQGGYNQVIYRMNNRDDVPGYGYQIRKGATALTESWQALRNVSNDHMMLGHLMEWFYSGLGGIRQQKGSVGYKKILIKPQFVKGINWVNCSYQSINGEIMVNWKKDLDHKIKVHVEIPANTTAKIILSIDHSNKKPVVKEMGSGKYDFSLQF